MPGQATINPVGKKKHTPDSAASRTPSEPEKVVMYLEVPPEVKALMERLAKLHHRKLTGECINAFMEYIERNGLQLPAPEA